MHNGITGKLSRFQKNDLEWRQRTKGKPKGPFSRWKQVIRKEEQQRAGTIANGIRREKPGVQGKDTLGRDEISKFPYAKVGHDRKRRRYGDAESKSHMI